MREQQLLRGEAAGVAACQPGAIADSENMRIDRNGGLPERAVEHHVGGFSTDAR